METAKFKTPDLMSGILLVLMFVQSLYGLLNPSIFANKGLWTYNLQANNWVTFFGAVPLLGLGYLFARRGSLRARMVWIGVLGYALFIYIYYLLAAPFGGFFLFYVTLVVLSLYTLILGLAAFDPQDLRRRFSEKTPVHWISGWIIFFALTMGFVEVSECLGLLFSGVTTHDLILVYAIDLSLEVPAIALGGILLWQRRTWGYLLGTLMMVLNTLYIWVLMVEPFVYRMMGHSLDWSELPLYVFLEGGCLLASLALLKNIPSRKDITATD